MGEPKFTPGRQQSLDNLAKLKAGLRLQPHPDVTVAFDLATAALVDAVNSTERKMSAAEITRRMFRAVMDAGFMIMHRDEMRDAILVAAQCKKAMEPLAEEEAALLKASPGGTKDAG